MLGRLNDVWSSLDGVIFTLVLSSAPWSGRQSATTVVQGNSIYLCGGNTGLSKFIKIYVSFLYSGLIFVYQY